MIKEIKYFAYIAIILIFLFLLLKFYFSDEYEKNYYKNLNNQNNILQKESKKLTTLQNNTINIIEYIDTNKNKSKKNYQFWKLIEND